MKKTLLTGLWAVTVLLISLGFIGVRAGMAVEEHHKSDTGEQTSVSTGAPSPRMMTGPGSGSGQGMMGMMGGSEDKGGHGMMGMMGGPGEKGGPGMMGMMDQGMMGQGMMHMMMSQMMGGPRGMGQMMGQMASGMMDRSGGPGGMARMGRILEDLDLSPEQWNQVRALAREQLGKMVDLWAERMKLRIELAGLRWDQQIDSQKVKDVFAREAQARAEMLLAGFEYLRNLKGVLTQDQWKQLEGQGP